MAILAADDAGGGVIWATQVIEDANDMASCWAKTCAFTTARMGQTLPANVGECRADRTADLATYPEARLRQTSCGLMWSATGI